MVSTSPSPAPAARPPKRSESPLFFEEREDEDETEFARPSSTAVGPSPVKMEVDHDDQVDQLMENVLVEQPPPVEPVAGPSSSGRSTKGKAVQFKAELVDSGDEIEYLSGTTPQKTRPAGIKRKVVDSDDDEVDQVMAPPSSSASKGKARAPASQVQIQKEVLPALSSEGGYIGDMVVQAMAMTRGKGYIKPGSKIIIKRADQAPPPPPKQAPTPVKGKKGQQTLTSMFKTPKGKSAIKPPPWNSITRFTNEKGFEVGRLEFETSDWLAHLLDLHVVNITGKVIDCSNPLKGTGDPILLSLSVYLTPQAFEEIKRPLATDKKAADKKVAFGESKETDQEKKMGKRKDGLAKLFKEVSIRPTRASALNNHQASADHEAALAALAGLTKRSRSRSMSVSSSSSKRSVSPEKVKGDKEDKAGKGKGKAKEDDSDTEEEDGAEVDEDQIEGIYAKAQKNDRLLGEIEPADTFTYTLRPYQKQALKWMSDIELGVKSGREASLHPLWSEYAFKPMPSSESSANEIIDVDQWEQERVHFYYNAYSGELSLAFPRANHILTGGILADVMGMGKTLMVAALIHTNRSATEPEPSASVDDAPFKASKSSSPEVSTSRRRTRRQLTLDTSFRPVTKKQAIESSDPESEDGAEDPAFDAADYEEGQERAKGKGKGRASRYEGPTATLVVAPVSLLHQWESELKKSAKKNSLRMFIYHGTSREEGLDFELEPSNPRKADVVLTSYGVLASEHQKWSDKKKKNKDFRDEPISLFNYEWLRVVLDEAHNIKSRSTKAAKACYALESQRRWCLSGTPLQNRLEDLFSLLCFLRMEPWGNFSFFRSFITVPFQKSDPAAIEVVQFILESCLLRRDKTMRDVDGKLIVELPDKIVTLETLDFSPLERKFYDSLYTTAKRQYTAYQASGSVGKNYGRIFSMLMKLRQAALHPLLVKRSENDTDDVEVKEAAASRSGRVSIQEIQAQFAGGDDQFKKAALKSFLDGEVSECFVCQDEPEVPAILPCGHHGCKACLVSCIEVDLDQGKKPACPICDASVSLEDIVEARGARKTGASIQVIDENGDAEGDAEEPTWVAEKTDKGPAPILLKNDFRSSTKLDALIKHLDKASAEDPKLKALVFSHFTSFLDIVEKVLDRNDYRFVRLDGSLTIKEREAVLSEFAKPNKQPLIFLLSIKSGGVGINLTQANHVFLMDLWWNLSVEEQAIDRCHRIGQTRPVHVVRFIVDHTIENRILRIQDRKEALVSHTLGGAEGSDAAKNLELLFSD